MAMNLTDLPTTLPILAGVTVVRVRDAEGLAIWMRTLLTGYELSPDLYDPLLVIEFEAMGRSPFPQRAYYIAYQGIAQSWCRRCTRAGAWPASSRLPRSSRHADKESAAASPSPHSTTRVPQAIASACCRRATWASPSTAGSASAMCARLISTSGTANRRLFTSVTQFDTVRKRC